MNSQKSLVLVIGAGASNEVGLPVGIELKNRIASALDLRFNGNQQINGDTAVMEALYKLAQEDKSIDINSFVAAALHIRNAMPLAPSIDNFIHAHNDNKKIEQCGKLAIAKCILEAEANSLLQMTSNSSVIDFVGVGESWYNVLFRLLVAPTHISGIPQLLSRITIISFNYDRCVEHYFHSGLMHYYGVDNVHATELVRNLKILHPYGYLGPLAWSDVMNPVPFGTKPYTEDLIKIAQNLKTFTEGTDQNQSDIMAIRTAIYTAGKIAFLGFAFNEQNLDLLFNLNVESRSMRDVPVYGTAYGLSSSDTEAITDELATMGRINPDLIRLERDHKCARLISDYGRALKV